MPNNPVQEAIREIVRQEIKSAFGFGNPQPTTSPSGPVKRRVRRNRPAIARRPKATLYGAGKGQVSNPKTDRRLKSNRDNSEE